MSETDYKVLFAAVYAKIANTAKVAQKLRFPFSRLSVHLRGGAAKRTK